LPRWVYLPLSVLAFWSYKQTKPAQAIELRSLSPGCWADGGGVNGTV